MMSSPPAPADASIDTQKQLAYWNSIDATPNGMLGGFEQVSRVDIQGSRNFLAKLPLRKPSTGALRIADCGAGIGRITKNLLTKLDTRAVVDIVEPVQKFTDALRADLPAEAIGTVFNVGLADWTPEPGAYWIIWNQWCVGHLTDAELAAYLRRCGEGVVEGGIVVVKENLAGGEGDEYDETDSSVTRTDGKFRAVFKEAGLRVVRTEVQRGMPAGLYAVRSYALQAV
ncbi:alpha-N-methyltransferase NTM1 [Geopyxis carbonaria]|nr:alpha-N-methyltransferase NTM1 [Geopyxis carbonaria]